MDPSPHADSCKARLALEASKRGRWPDCHHGRQVCRHCDPCTCGLYEELERRGITPVTVLRSMLHEGLQTVLDHIEVSVEERRRR